MLPRTFSSWGKLLGLGHAAPEVEDERRRFGRIRCDVETLCRAAAGDHADVVRVQVKNVSRGGACLLSSRHFRGGELLCVRIPAALEDPPDDVLACVVRCDPATGGHWEVGCTFAQHLTDDDLRCFGACRDLPLQAEQRAQPRFPCPAQAAYQVVRTPESTTWTPAAVVDISCGGIALSVAEALFLGDLLTVELRRDGIEALTALASVVRTTVMGDRERIIGCNFIHELPEAQVAELLGIAD